MDDTEDDARYPPNPSYAHGFKNHSSSSHHLKLPVRSATTLSNNGAGYDGEGNKEEEESDYEEDDDSPQQRHRQRQQNLRPIDNDGYGDEDDDEEAFREGSRENACRLEKLKYESAAWKPNQPSPSHPRPAPVDWTEAATDVLLDVWGDRFIQLGRKNLRSDEWLDVAKKVSAITKTHLSDTQCRNRLDTLKKKYKREKLKILESGGAATGGSRSVYFKRMESLISSSSQPQPPVQQSRQPLACELDSGEYVFANSKVHINQPNGLEIRDSSESGSEDDQEAEDEDDDSNFPPPKKVKLRSASGRAAEGKDEDAGSFRMLAESIQKFGEIYEKIENSKRQQMVELEKMRMEFRRDLEMQKRQILERAQAEIARIHKEDNDIDTPMTNGSG